MSWSIPLLAGTKTGVRQYVEAFVGDAQFEAVRPFLLTEIDAMPDTSGVALEGNGSSENGYRSFNLRFYPLVVLCEPDPMPVPAPAKVQGGKLHGR